MLHIHRAERADRLADALAEVLRPPPADPFQADVVAVPTKGVERWLAQRLSHVLGASEAGDGVCANVAFPHPAAVVAEALAAVDAAPENDPWEPERLRWPLLEVIDESVGEPWCATLAAYLGAGSGDAGEASEAEFRRGRRLWVAGHFAVLFDAYGADRPGMVAGWVGLPEEEAASDGFGAELPADMQWQVRLWQRLRERIGTPSPAERLGPGCAGLRAAPERVPLPERLSVFGPTRLTRAQVDVLAALGRHREVHLWLPHPSPVLWASVRDHAAAASGSLRAEDPTAALPRNPLLSSFGRDSRELQLRVSVGEDRAEHHHHAQTEEATAGTDHLLARVQEAVREDRPTPAPDERSPLDPGDRSISVHACHGPSRQVEVLREVLVGLLADDPTLEPRDIVVMCPDIEEYAPLIAAAFGSRAGWGVEEDGGGNPDPEGHPGHRLRVRLADRSLRQTNAVLGALAALLDLVGSRLAVGAVLDFASLAPVRRRFRFDDDDLETMQEWLREAGVRWGLDLDHRRAQGLELAHNTWQAGLDRLLLGVAMDADDLRWVGLALPLDDVDSSDIDLAGRLAEFVDRLRSALDALRGPQPLAAWLAALETALDGLTDLPEEDGWQVAQARRVLAEVGEQAGDPASPPGSHLALQDLRTLLGDRLRGRPTRANFRTGDLTMCSMVPMRSVPHRVVCLLGLDDGHFPRAGVRDGDDILAATPRVAERDPRSEDRQLLLDALMAAQDHLVVLYTGADPRTNAHRAPAVPVAELLDTVDSLTTARGGGAARKQVIVHHPLQPFDARNFAPGELGREGPLSFDRMGFRGAQRALQPRQPAPAFLTEPVPATHPAERSEDLALGDLALEDLVAFLEAPVKAFLRRRLGISLFREEEDLPDEMPVELDGLQRWGVGDRLLQAVLSGAELERAEQAEWRRGTLPPGRLGNDVLQEVAKTVGPLLEVAGDCLAPPPEQVDIAVPLPGSGSRQLVGTVEVRGAVLARVVFSRLAPKHRLRAWVQLLALSAAEPDTAWTATTVGRGGRGPRTARLPTVAPDEAASLLAVLADLHDRGMTEVLPMATRTSARYADTRTRGMNPSNAARAARQAWEGEYGRPGERADAEYEQVYGPQAPYEVLIDAPARPDEAGLDGQDEESTRFGVLARRLWGPVLAREEVVGK